MNDKLIVILATIPILICGILVLIGKGRFLIAGYNILSESKKNKYNIRKIETILGIWVIFFGLNKRESYKFMYTSSSPTSQ